MVIEPSTTQQETIMGNLVTETPYSEVTATLELLDRLGVDRDGLKKFRKAASYLQFEIARLIQEGEERSPDSIIRVNRSVRPSYPDWAKTVMHPELEPTGPAEYDIEKVEQWLHDGQKDGKWIEGNKIYAHLKETDTLKTCLGLRDLEEIQKKGIAFFRKYFQGKAVFGWKSVVRNRYGILFVPCLCEDDDEVVVRWSWLARGWDGRSPALRFAS